MTGEGMPAATRRRVVVAASVVGSLLLAVVLAVVLLPALQGGSGNAHEGVAAGAVSETTGPSTPAPSPTVQPSEQPILRAQRTGSVEPERPLSVRLPSGRTIPVQAVSSKPDGRLDVPMDIDNAGWFRGGSALGDPFGSTLLAAHIDSATQGLGPFEELLGVRAGQRVTLTSAGLEQTFVIDSLRLVPQGSLDDQQWIYSPSGARRLTLVTCAPPYDRARGGYQNLAVVTALPVTDTPLPKD